MKTSIFRFVNENLYLFLLTLTMIPRVLPYGATVSDLFVFIFLVYLIVESRMFIRHKMDRFQATIVAYSCSLLILQLSVAFFASKSLFEPIKSFSALLYLFIGYTILKRSKTQFDDKGIKLILTLALVQLAISIIQFEIIEVSEVFRATGTFFNPNLLGSFIGTLAMFALYIQASRKTLLTILGISSLIILISGSMGSIVAFSSSIFLFFCTQKIKKDGIRTCLLSVAPWFLFPFSLILSVIIYRGFDDIIYSISSRLVVWRESLKYVSQNPFAPPENVIDWNLVAPSKVTNWTDAVTMDAHNDFLNFILEGGIIGGILYLVFFAILLRFTNLKYLAGINFLFVSGLSSSVMTYSWLMLFIAYLIYESTLTKVKDKKSK